MSKSTIFNVAATLVLSEREGGITAAEVADELEISGTAARNILAKLEQHNFLERDVMRKPYVWKRT